MTQMGLDIEAIEHLDWAFAPPCEADDGCDNAAAWKLTFSCCGHVLLLCDPCWEDDKETIKNWPDAVGTCSSCYNEITYGKLILIAERL